MTDHFETRRSSLLGGLVALLGSAFMLCFGRSEGVLIVARLLQGISAAVVWTVGIQHIHSTLTTLGLALIVDTVGEARVGQATAYVSSSMSIALILGPALGGIIYARRGYYAAFGLAFSFIGLDLVLRVILIEKKIALRYTTALQPPDEENTQSVKKQESHSVHIASATSESRPTPIGTNSPAVFGGQESRIPPIIRILKHPRLLVALLLSFVQALIISAFDATIPLHLNALFGYSSLQAGK
jgi:MFS family permease